VYLKGTRLLGRHQHCSCGSSGIHALSHMHHVHGGINDGDNPVVLVLCSCFNVLCMPTSLNGCLPIRIWRHLKIPDVFRSCQGIISRDAEPPSTSISNTWVSSDFFRLWNLQRGWRASVDQNLVFRCTDLWSNQPMLPFLVLTPSHHSLLPDNHYCHALCHTMLTSCLKHGFVQPRPQRLHPTCPIARKMFL